MAKKVQAKTKAKALISYSGSPQMISETCWFYETKKGLLFCVEARVPDGSLLKAVQFTMPWREVVAVADKYHAVREASKV